jgi:predicted nucleic-acid-binding Zn-ribbon protein
MTSKLKCPFCQTELEYDFGYDGDYSCRKCGRNKMFGSEELWQALIQAKQDLEIARKALEKLNCEYNHCRYEEFEGADIDWEWWAIAAKNIVETAVKQIDHIADASNMVEHKES